VLCVPPGACREQGADLSVLPAAFLEIGCDLSASPAQLGVLNLGVGVSSSMAGLLAGVLAGMMASRTRLAAIFCLFWGATAALMGGEPTHRPAQLTNTSCSTD
jgi:hypothetical protein